MHSASSDFFMEQRELRFATSPLLNHLISDSNFLTLTIEQKYEKQKSKKKKKGKLYFKEKKNVWKAATKKKKNVKESGLDV